ncbi:MAG: phosphatase PAP2-related protein [Candidatus Moraniibacteriota bacterium]
MNKILTKHAQYWRKSGVRLSAINGALFFLISLEINRIASIYATTHASNPVEDIILSNTRVWNVDFIVNEGALLFALFVFFILLFEPKRIAFTLKASALFIFIRSIFISLTHLAPFPTQATLNPNDLFSVFNFGGDFFFSGHTGFPLLIALIFWNVRPIRIISIIVSLIFGTAVLLGHLHYSIDVFAAFFITYSIFHLALRFFARDYKVFYEIEES